MKRIDSEAIKHLQATEQPRRKDHLQRIVDTGRLLLYSHNSNNHDAKARMMRMHNIFEETSRDLHIASAPAVIARLAKADKSFGRENYFGTWSKELIGTDTTGKLAKPGEVVQIFLHGMTPLSTSESLYVEEGTDMSLTELYQHEFSALLQGRREAQSIDIYHISEVRREEVTDPFGTYAVWMSAPLTSLNSYTTEPLGKKAFMNSSHVLARAGTAEYLEEFFDRHNQNGVVVSGRVKSLPPNMKHPYVSITQVSAMLSKIAPEKLYKANQFMIYDKEEQQ